MWPWLAFAVMVAIVLVSLDAWLGAPAENRRRRLRYELLRIVRRQRSPRC